MVANKLFAGFAVALALVSIATATKGPKDSGMRDTGTQNARDRKTLRRPQIPSPGPFPNIQPDERGLYEKSQEAANQCIEYYMHRLLHVDSVMPPPPPPGGAHHDVHVAGWSLYSN